MSLSKYVATREGKSQELRPDVRRIVGDVKDLLFWSGTVIVCSVDHSYTKRLPFVPSTKVIWMHKLMHTVSFYPS